MFNPSRSAGDTVKTQALAQALPWLLLGVLLLIAAAAGTGFVVGQRWNAGANAIKENKALRTDRAELLAAAEQLRDAGVESQSKFAAAAQRQSALAQETANENRKNQAFAREQAQVLEQLLRDRPDLDDVRVGDQLLCAWNRAAQGAAAGAATATPGCGRKPDAAVPGAAGGARRSRQHADPKPSGVGADAPRVHRSARWADPRGARARGDVAGVVVRRPATPRVVRRLGGLWLA